MARFGLSGYVNPVDSAIDAYSKLNSSWDQQDKLKMEQQDAASRRQLMSLQSQKMQGDLEEQAADKPVKAAQRQVEMQKASHKLLEAPLNSGMTKITEAFKTRTLPQLNADEITAAMQLQKQSGWTEDDLPGFLKQVGATNRIMQYAPQLQKNLMDHAKAVGHDKFMLDEKSAPGLAQDLAEAFGKGLGHQEGFSSIYVDMSAGGTITPVKADGTPMKDEDGAPMSIPFGELQNVGMKMQQVAPLIVSAHAAVDGDKKMRDEYHKTKDDYDHQTKLVDGVEDFSKWMKGEGAESTHAEQETELFKKLVSAGVPSDKAATEATRILKPEKERKLSPLVVRDKTSSTGWSYPDDQGNIMTQGAPKPPYEAKKEAGDGYDKVLTHMDIKDQHDSKKASRESVVRALKTWNKAKEAYAKDRTDENREMQNQERRAYESAMQEHADQFGESYTGGGDIDRKNRTLSQPDPIAAKNEKSSQTKKATPQGLPEGATPAGNTPDGRPQYRLPDGQIIAPKQQL